MSEFMPELTLISAAIAGALFGASITALSVRSSNRQKAETLAQLSERLDQTQSTSQHLQQQLMEASKAAALVDELQSQRQTLQTQLSELQHTHAKLFANHKALQSGFAQKEQSLQEKIELLAKNEQKLSEQFEQLANKVFEQQRETFTQSNHRDLNALLTPLKEQIDTFKRQLSDQHVREGQERASLKTEILGLKALNQRITDEAAALTMALKGDNKQQGNWGEVVLQRVLEQSGLREGYEFESQVSLQSQEGKKQQPDVVVHLPNKKDIIIDSKVSLAAYERFFNASDETIKDIALKEHIASLRGHIKGLGKKDYQTLPGLKTLDYVLMFVPIEPAFLLAVDKSPDLIPLALSNNIMLVSPTNLLVALRTIHNIWQYEYQHENAQKIAQHGAKLYDKFSNFITDMEKLGKSLETSHKHFDSALNKLSQGRNNLVSQVEQFKELGVQPSKTIPKDAINQLTK